MKQAKRLLSILLAAVMLASILAVGAGATNVGNDTVIRAQSITAFPGSTASVNIVIENNPGILGASFALSYGSALTLTEVKAGDAFSALTMTRPGRLVSGCRFVWDGTEISAEDIKDGVILTLTFAVSESARVGSIQDLEISYQAGDIVDNNLRPVSVSMVSGAVTIVDYIPGDLNGDNIVNTTDIILLRRHIAGGYDVEINVTAADVNDDTKLNTSDLILIRRYIADGCKTDPEGYNVVLKPSQNRCAHVMQATEAHPATCTEDGNIAYWYCSVCEKYFGDAEGTREIAPESIARSATGHTPVTDAAVDPTYEHTGLTEGSHCSACDEILVKQSVIPMLEQTQYPISYSIYGNDTYLKEIGVTNPNPQYYTAESGLTLLEPEVAGYVFEGWYDGSGSTAAQIKSIPVGSTGTKQLYAHWSKIEYTIQFDSPLYPVSSAKYSVDSGITLIDPSLAGYTFMGWSDDNGSLVDRIDVGTTGNITLKANWTSKRNQTRPVEQLGEPVIYHDTAANQILFAYEIGTIENVPLYEIEYLGNKTTGVTYEKTTTTSGRIIEATAESIAKTISEATTQTSTWSLSDSWTDSTTKSEEHSSEVSSETLSSINAGKSSSGTWNVGSSKGGSTATAVEAGVSAKVGAKVSTETEASAEIPLEVVKIGAKVGTEISAELGATVSSSRSDTKNWNTNVGYSASRSASMNASLSRSLGKKISDSVSYDVSNSVSETSSTTQSTAESSTNTRECASEISYSTETTETQSVSYSNAGAPEGYYRVVQAGTIHVFAVVTYDIASYSYGVYTYSVMEDEVRNFIDYSRSTSHFDDEENGVLPFEVPFFVNDYVDSIVGASDGLVVDLETGMVEEYRGTDNVVVIPQYLPVDNDDGTVTVVRITGFKADVFAGNTNLLAVKLCDNITEIPAGAFAGCSALKMVVAPAVTKIGANAFDGCAALNDYTVPSTVTSLGANAFGGVGKVTVDASNAGIADAAIVSGAKNIVLNLSGLTDTYSNRKLEIPATAEYFEFNGANKTYSGVKITSAAATTVINGATFTDNTGTVLKLSSGNVTLNRVTVNTTGWAMVLTQETTALALYGNVNLTTSGTDAVVCADIQLSRANPSAAGKLNVTGNMLVYGEITGQDYLTVSNGEIVYIDETRYNALKARWEAGSFEITLDANGGTVSETSVTAICDEPVKPLLPTPELDYFTFLGWYTEAGEGDLVGDQTSFSDDLTLYAHWKANDVSDWVPASELPTNATVVNQKWTYSERTDTESTSTSLDGYTQTGSYWVQSGTGSTKYSTAFPSGFDKSHTIYTTFAKAPYTNSETETSKRTVTNSKTGYVYWHWMYDCGTGGGVSTRAIYNKKGTGPDNGFNYKFFGAFTSTKSDYDSSTTYCNSLGIRNYIIPERSSYAKCQGALRWFRFSYSTSTYTDYYKMFQYTKTETKESLTAVTATDLISNVQEWVQYRLQ